MDPLVIIPKRTSRRSYEGTPISAEHVRFIKNVLEKNSVGPLGSKIKFQLVTRKGLTNRRVKLGTYGFIQGAQNFIVGEVAPRKEAFLDYGYCLEKVILELTEVGLGTCWLGGTFDRGEFSKAIDLSNGNVIPAISPVGYATSRRSIGDRIIRAGAGSKKRKGWDELFFDAETMAPVNPDCLGSKAQWVEMLRIAPSASNLQPWRVLFKDGRLDLFLNRKKSYQKMFGNIDIQMLDIGIAMSHLHMMAEQEKLPVSWSVNENPSAVFDWEYVISLNY